MTKRASGGLVLLLLALLFVGATVISNLVLRGARIDLTANNEYTLSDGSKEILASIDEPINLYFYFSDEASRDLAPIRTYAQRVRELLEEMASRTGGKLKLSVIDPQPFSEEEDEATAAGLQSVPVGSTGDKLFFGLAGSNSLNGKASIPFFQPDKEVFLEYDVAKLIQGLIKPDKPVIGLISSLPIGGGFDPTSQKMSDPWAVMQQLDDMFEVRPLGLEVKQIDKDVKLLMVVHPKALADDTVYAIEQFVLGGGRLLLFVDPNSNVDQSGADPQNPSAAMFADKSSNLEKLLAAWGVDFKADQVVVDRALGLQVQISQTEPPVTHPLILGLRKEQMNPEDLVSAKLNLVNIDSAGHFKLKEGATVKLEPLLQSSSESTTVSTERTRFLPDPRELLKDFAPSGENYMIAARLSGKLKSAFPDRASAAGHIAESAEDVQAILVADTDILSNRLWVQVQNFFGQQLMNPFADNGDLITNSADNLSGSSALISIRGRSSSTRPFEVVEDMRRAADERFRATEEQLQAQLTETERKLNELQAAKGDENAMIMTPEQQAEILRFQSEKLRIRKELRDVRRSLDQDIQSLGSRTKFINIALVPLGVIIAALLFWNLRRGRRRSAMAGA
ncbi:MAG: Gldg family protein [Rhodanobacteraceae bacterium]|nr:Gldg family protein [Rhodanobacteraceae bacterium]